jgi:restriction system protein
MSVPKYDELMKPLLLAVQDGSIYKIKDVTTTLAQQFKLAEEDIAMMLPAEGRRYSKNE